MQRPQMQLVAQWILSHPPLLYCSGSVFRGTIAVALGYLGAGCPPGPLDDTTIAALARIPPSQWKISGPGIKAALETLLPVLARRYLASKIRSENFRAQHANAGRLGLITKARNAKKMVEPPQPIPFKAPASNPQAPAFRGRVERVAPGAATGRLSDG